MKSPGSWFLSRDLPISVNTGPTDVKQACQAECGLRYGQSPSKREWRYPDMRHDLASCTHSPATVGDPQFSKDTLRLPSPETCCFTGSSAREPPPHRHQPALTEPHLSSRPSWFSLTNHLKPHYKNGTALGLGAHENNLFQVKSS